jgi:hypothetical protein
VLSDLLYGLGFVVVLALSLGASRLRIGSWWVLAPGATACGLMIAMSGSLGTCQTGKAFADVFFAAGMVAVASIVLASLTAFVNVARGGDAAELLIIAVAGVVGFVTMFGYVGDAIGNCMG